MAAARTSPQKCALVTSFIGGVLGMLVSGTLYAYGSFSAALESQLDISVAASGWIMKVGNLGLCIAVPAGMAADRLGLRACALIGGFLSVLGYGLLWLCTTGRIGGGAPALAVFYFIAGQGCQFTYMPGLMNYKNLPARLHGLSLGVLDMSFGLSSVVFSRLYAGTYGRSSDPAQQDLSGFILFMASAMLAVNALNTVVLTVDTGLEKERLVDTEAAVGAAERSAASASVLRSLNFWLVFLYFLISQGTALWLIGAVSDMASAFALPASRGPWLVTLLTSVGAVCRISSGVISDLLRSQVSRPMLLFFASLLLPLGFLLLALNPAGCLPVGAALIGAAFGSSWCLVPLALSDAFGMESFGRNWGIVIVASALGPFLLQPVDDAVQHAHQAEAGPCVGEACYRTTYVVSAVASLVASGLVLVAARRLRQSA